MLYIVTLEDKGVGETLMFDGTDEVPIFAEKALELYQRANPSNYGGHFMVQIDNSLACQHEGQTELFVSRARFAKSPKRDDAKPRWGRWHNLTVEKVPS